MVTDQEFQDLAKLRRDLHRLAEIAGEEEQTAARLFKELEPAEMVSGLGGHGVAAIFEGSARGKKVLLRADMDGLPIHEKDAFPHASKNAGRAHKCGHDGHMSILVGVARRFRAEPPSKGRLVLLFQPAEETGAGARAVIDDPAFAPLKPDIALALHNLPGFPLGQAVFRPGPFACASRGLVAFLTGKTSHAAEPEQGRSPALAVAQIIQAWSAARQFFSGLNESVQATIIHASVGREAFGTSPGEGVVMATLRAPLNSTIEKLERRLRSIAQGIAQANELQLSFETREPFPATVNDPEIITSLEKIAQRTGLSRCVPEHPFPWSEDFGHFGSIARSALVGLGAGLDHPALHHPEYDFPDELIPTGVDFLEAASRHWLDGDHD